MSSMSRGHREHLPPSAISEDVIVERGYRIVTTTSDHAVLAFRRSQQNAPALLIPIRNVHGDMTLYQSRPDIPRIVNGKPTKYETPASTSLALDVPVRP